MARRILRIREVLFLKGNGRSSTYTEIKTGLFVPPVHLSERSVGWPSDEVEKIVAARIAGKSENEIRDLVANLVADRKVAAGGSHDA